jgi:hypothetical protein
MVIDTVISQSDIVRFLNHHQAALGRSWQTFPATSLTRIVSLHVMS